MAANRFATMLHRKTNRITVILVYAALEWCLILLLFLSSLFSHLIIKFANLFGLQPPCLWCTRIDHIFGSSNGNKNLHRDLLCEAHAKQVSRFGFCSIHHRLAESQDMCHDCLFSMPEFGCFSGTKDFGFTPNDEMDQTSKCSCCGILICRTSSLDDLAHAHVSKEGDNGFDYLESYDSDKKTQVLEDDNVKERVHVFKESSSNPHLEYFLDHTGHNLVLVKDEEITNIKCDDKAENQECRSVIDTEVVKREALSDDNGRFTDLSVDKDPKDTEFEALSDGNDRFIDLGISHEPKNTDFEVLSDDDVRFIDLGVSDELKGAASEALTDENSRFINLDTSHEPKDADFEALSDANDRFIDPGVSDEAKDAVFEASADDKGRFIDLGVDNESEDAVSGSILIEDDENSIAFQEKDIPVNHSGALSTSPFVDARDSQETAEAGEAKPLDSLTDDEETEEAAQLHIENEAVVSIGTEIPELDMSDELRIIESVHTCNIDHGDNLSGIAAVHKLEVQGSEQVEEQTAELQPLSLDHSASFNSETPENEEDRVPDTPASMDSFVQLHKKVLFLEKRNSWTEESFDGSVTSELEVGDGVVTVESLKSALKAERKALKILYTEFEEERSASAVAANQTMAMINRLQEEKAAMQMEALQYQRMMEEQSEYDQDALQLMNELLVKRESEKRELERELEECRKKLFEYEVKEEAKVYDKNCRNGFSASFSIHADENETETQELGEESASHNMAIEVKEPLFDFEHQRLSILEQLSALEEKLSTLNDAKDQHPVQTADAHLITSGEDSVHANGSLDNTADSKHRKRDRSTVHKGRSLLPLFDAICDDQTVQSNGVHSTEQDYEEEMCHLYERLEALEADKEFLVHCISSLKQGDKELVHEILHSLRELRNVGLQARGRQHDSHW